MALGINRNRQNTVVINNYYGQQGMGSSMGMGQMGGPHQMMQMMMQMMQMMMQMMQMMMGGGCQQCMPGQFPGIMPGMGMPGMGGGMPGCGGGFSPQMGNCLGNFMGMPGGGSGAYASAGPGGAYAGAYSGGPGGAYSGAYAGPGGAGAIAGGGPLAGSGSGVAAVNTARRFLGRNAIDIKGQMPHFTAAGGQTNNCADFVSSALESQGLLRGHEINVERLEQSLLRQGYRRIPPEQARPGDVWINQSRGHTELVQGVQRGRVSTIGSNNDRPGHQVISERTKAFNSGIIYGRR
ncbi:MAG: peptidoglycan amidohydrolase family protein [Candidatus Eremiobacterota bacterium]